MKRLRPFRFIHYLALLSGISHLLSTAHGQGTPFTYQGRLDDGGNPANGLYDLCFTIYDAVTNGNPVSGVLTNAATPVTNGLVTVTLDFGASIFVGNDRWLNIAVRTNDSGAAFTTLTPRQQITPAPYALYAHNAGNAAMAATAGSAGSVAAVNISGTLSLAQLPYGLITN